MMEALLIFLGVMALWFGLAVALLAAWHRIAPNLRAKHGPALRPLRIPSDASALHPVSCACSMYTLADKYSAVIDSPALGGRSHTHVRCAPTAATPRYKQFPGGRSQ